MIDIEKMIHEKYPKLKNNKIVKSAIGKFAASITHQDTINQFVKNNAHLGSFEFIETILETLEFSYTLSDTHLQNIPATGRVVIVANHPLGGLDALILIHAISRVRKDIKIVANDFLSKIYPLKPIMIEINNFKSRQSRSAISEIYETLNSEGVVIIFPAGEVSRATPKGIKDAPWQKSFLKFASTTSAPILPVFIGGKNSKTFYSVSALNKSLSTLLLANELFKQKNKEIPLIIGEIIPTEHIFIHSLTKDTLVQLYKKHVYALKKGQSYFKTQKAIAQAEDRRYIKQELNDSELLGATKDGKKIYLYKWTQNNSSVLNEIGRLREISFRQVGEGINKKRDIDKYDRYYKHIVLWDEDDLEIVGSYRIGVTSEIVAIDALYTHTLFEHTKDFDRYLTNSIELGRSFVQPKYWGSRALDYLWQGIGAYLKNNPQIRYMYGPVSLSASYPKVAKDMILYFYTHYFPAKKELVIPRIPYKIDFKDEYFKILQSELLLDNYKEDFKTLKHVLSLLKLSIPTLYKQYADFCDEGGIEFCAYNLDKDFSNCVDSFIVVEIDKIKEKQKKRYLISTNKSSVKSA